MNENEMELNFSEQERIRHEKLRELMNAGESPYSINTYDRDTYVEKILNNFETLENTDVKIAGRMITRRDMGKANFINIADFTGNIQVYIKLDDVGEAKFAAYKKWDIGDIIGIAGKVFKTRRGEVSVHAYDIVLLSKCLVPLPEKWHGLKDVELRYRQRYLDLIVNPEVKKDFIARSRIIRAMRTFLDGEGFIEVETPVLSHIAGGAAARPFLTHHNALDLDMTLRISLELYLKRLIVGGFDKVYEIGRVFRNEGISVKHNPEYTLMELYQTYTDYRGIMDLTERMIKYIAKEVCGTLEIRCGGDIIDLSKPFEVMTMSEAVKKYTGIDFDTVATLEEARRLAKEHHVKFEDRHKKGDILYLFFDEFAESKLIQPVFITEHPVEISPLAKKVRDKPEYTERFELFIKGMEQGNAFSELNDPIDQRERFAEQIKNKNAGDEEAYESDEDFLTALEYGMPPTGGLGIGVDRLAMLLADVPSIRDILLFPTMKPKE